MNCSFKIRFVIEKVVENRMLKEEMYFKTKIAVFVLVVALNLQIIPAEWLSRSKFFISDIIMLLYQKFERDDDLIPIFLLYQLQL